MHLKAHYTVLLPNTRLGHVVPPEDAAAANCNHHIFCVADGVTLGPIPYAPDRLTEAELREHYPNPSPARVAADICCAVVTDHVDARIGCHLRTRFLAANRAIAQLNADRPCPINYRDHDYYCCVAAAVKVHQERRQLSWCYIGDCGVALYRKDGRLDFRTPDAIDPFVGHMLAIGGEYDSPQPREETRRVYRNRIVRNERGVNVGYGALSGEAGAEEYILTGEAPLEAGDLIIVYSDGLTKMLDRPGFFEVVYQPTASRMEQRFLPWALNLRREHPRQFVKETTMTAILVV